MIILIVIWHGMEGEGGGGEEGGNLSWLRVVSFVLEKLIRSSEELLAGHLEILIDMLV